MKRIYLAGGCFWGMQKFLNQFDGVLGTEVGYANGEKAHPSYEDVCSDSGHAETVRIDFDEKIISTDELLKYYFMAIDPTAVNHQGGDYGIQYRTGIYYEDDGLLPDIEKAMAKEQEKHSAPIAVEVKRLENFYTAEEYHQDYLDKNPGGYCHISPALMNIKKMENSHNINENRKEGTMKILVSYFSAEKGRTEKVAKAIAKMTDCDLFEISPVNPYAPEDLKYINPFARCNREKFGKKDVEVEGRIENFGEYDLIIIGFPIWYGCAPNVVNTFAKGYDWTGKKVAIFATSGGSGIGKTAEKLSPYIKGADIKGAKVIRKMEELKIWLSEMIAE